MKVERVYTKGVVSVPKAATVEEAAELMLRHHVGALVVTEDRTASSDIVGFLTDRDIVLQAVAEGLDTSTLPVAEVMSPVLATVRESADLHEALEMMRGGGMRRLAVADAEDRIVGMLSIDDAISALAADLASLAGVLRRGRQREVAQSEAPSMA
jgi:CBS domain-containing protein